MKEKELYCNVCSNELMLTGSAAEESYYICPSCNAEYSVAYTGHTLVIQADIEE